MFPSRYVPCYVQPFKHAILTKMFNLAMTKSQTEISHVEQPKKVTHKIIEAPATYELLPRDSESNVHGHSGVIYKPSHHTIAAQPRPHTDDLIPRSEHSQHTARPNARNGVESVTNAPHIFKTLVAGTKNSRVSHTTSHGRTARQSDFISITEARSAKDVPFPDSHVTSLVKEAREHSKADENSISPNESVSQVSTRRSGGVARSNHHSSHHGSGGQRSRTSKK